LAWRDWQHPQPFARPRSRRAHTVSQLTPQNADDSPAVARENFHETGQKENRIPLPKLLIRLSTALYASPPSRQTQNIVLS